MANIPKKGKLFYTKDKELKLGDGIHTSAELPVINIRLIKGKKADNPNLVLGDNDMFYDKEARAIYFGNGTTQLKDSDSAINPIKEANDAIDQRMASYEDTRDMLAEVFGV